MAPWKLEMAITALRGRLFDMMYSFVFGLVRAFSLRPINATFKPRGLLKSNSQSDVNVTSKACVHFKTREAVNRSTRSMYGLGSNYVIDAVRRAVGVTNRAHNP